MEYRPSLRAPPAHGVSTGVDGVVAASHRPKSPKSWEIQIYGLYRDLYTRDGARGTPNAFRMSTDKLFSISGPVVLLVS